ncbi:hypothetical protein EDEG_02316 [Edhazardia aedis USNM 41457]|uniref:Secreted protein n=1 Tax=Edhazardia aedis (strain USNM 41457) TaxID=1003232 RepID=J9D747_EDHAE|nr:hypothetical protein EDEG_02316 [Edhazardia aedis USNM 41457]|eukprot:EJW03359.1 hypothetical protein EDEG_02316 [Edhazardia aedis USNM 41457]
MLLLFTLLLDAFVSATFVNPERLKLGINPRLYGRCNRGCALMSRKEPNFDALEVPRQIDSLNNLPATLSRSDKPKSRLIKKRKNMSIKGARKGMKKYKKKHQLYSKQKHGRKNKKPHHVLINHHRNHY